MTHTIFGAGGPVANALTRILEANGQTTRLVSRRPITTTGHTSWQQADLCDRAQTLSAAEGASVIYLCAGLKYDSRVWQEQWPRIMQNAIDAAKSQNARLIFFDNVYMYGPVHGPMTEATPYRPASRKGHIRAAIADKLMNEATAGRLQASIARSADFYGAQSANSFLDGMVLQRLSQGKKAQWLGNPDALHAFTYVPDAARAVYMLGQDPGSDNRIWHLPTAPALSGRQLMELAASSLNCKPAYQRITKGMLQMLGIFNRMIQENVEMYYQYSQDYIFDSSAFERRFGIQPTSYETGIAEACKRLSEAARS